LAVMRMPPCRRRSGRVGLHLLLPLSCSRTSFPTG
jgi:hypothetical protein